MTVRSSADVLAEVWLHMLWFGGLRFQAAHAQLRQKADRYVGIQASLRIAVKVLTQLVRG